MSQEEAEVLKSFGDGSNEEVLSSPNQNVNKNLEVAQKKLTDYFNQMSEKHQVAVTKFESANTNKSAVMTGTESPLDAFFDGGLLKRGEIAEMIRKAGVDIDDLGYGVTGSEFKGPFDFDPIKKVYFTEGSVNCVIKNERTGEILFEHKYPEIRLYSEEDGDGESARLSLANRIKEIDNLASKDSDGKWHESAFRVQEGKEKLRLQKAKKTATTVSRLGQQEALDNLARLRQAGSRHDSTGIPLSPEEEDIKSNVQNKGGLVSRIKRLFGKK